jgi:hypothetical protein
MAVINAIRNMVRIGFTNPEAARIASINQQREPMFWFSPKDQQTIGQIVSEVVSAEKRVITEKTA